jgi:hypothetical protein
LRYVARVGKKKRVVKAERSGKRLPLRRALFFSENNVARERLPVAVFLSTHDAILLRGYRGGSVPAAGKMELSHTHPTCGERTMNDAQFIRLKAEVLSLERLVVILMRVLMPRTLRRAECGWTELGPTVPNTV